MKRKFRIKKNIELTENDIKLNYFSNSIFFLSCILFLFFGWLNNLVPYETANPRDIAGLMIMFVFLVTIVFALTLQLSVEMRLIFSLLFLVYTMVSHHQLFLIYTRKVSFFFAAISITFLCFVFSKSLLALIFPKKFNPANKIEKKH